MPPVLREGNSAVATKSNRLDKLLHHLVDIIDVIYKEKNHIDHIEQWMVMRCTSTDKIYNNLDHALKR